MNLIDRLKIAGDVLQKLSETAGLSLEYTATVVAAYQELDAIWRQLEVQDRDYTRQTDELLEYRKWFDDIYQRLVTYRREFNIWEKDVSRPPDVVFLLTHMADRLRVAEDDAAAMRGVIEHIRDTARHGLDYNMDLTDARKRQYMDDALGLIEQQAGDGLKAETGAAMRKDLRQLEEIVESFEKGVQASGGWRYSGDRTLAERVRRCVDHYTHMAARAVGDAISFKDGMVGWLRGIAINAQSVSWAQTHAEKDARLRGMIEVIETAIKNVNELRINDRLTDWGGEVDSWMKSDFPTREMRRRILDQEREIERLKAKAGEGEHQSMSVDSV